MDPTSLLLFTVVSALLGALFAAADAALGSIPTARLQALLEQTSPSLLSRALARYEQNPGRVLGRYLFLRTLFTVLTAALVAELPVFQAHGLRPLPASLVSLVALFLAYEIAAALARARARDVGPWMLVGLLPLELLAVPFADPVSTLARALARARYERPPSEEARLVEAEVERLIETAAAQDRFGQEPAAMIRNVLDFKDLVARDVMLPRRRFSTIDAKAPLEDVVRIVSEDGHTRYPVYADRKENVIGVLYAKDLFRLIASGELAGRTAEQLTRTPANFVVESQPVADLLRTMRQRHHHMAIVVDELGAVSGLVTLEDVLERIVGEIRDEYDSVEIAPIQDLGDGRLLVDASVSLADLSTFLGVELEPAGDYASLGGLVVFEHGGVPPVGATIVAAGLELVVRESDDKHVIKVEIVLPPDSSIRSVDPAPR